MTWLNLFAAALATWEAIEIFHHGSIFATVRAHLACRSSFFAHLARCPFCLSPWVAAVAVGCVLVPVLNLLLYALAVARLANLGNDLAQDWCQTPKGYTLPDGNNAEPEEADDAADDSPAAA